MQNFIAKSLKFLLSTIVIVCALTSAFITPNFESSSSILNINAIYSLVPYKDSLVNEVTLAGEYPVLDTFVGTVTAYGPDCVGCIGITSSGYKVAERENGVFKTITTTYNDSEYGELRILAAANTKFPIGTVMRMSGANIDGYIIGIVLDTGSAMRQAWSRGEILIDLMFETENSDEVYIFGRRRNVTMEILRYGR
ncbi:MAG: 3D domain-containing protein [Bacilli bacterium]|nr:3D domain-containing protein [Bacilli bacterium]